MPEGPEIRKAADRLEAAIVDQPAVEVFFAFDHLKPYEAKLTGCTIKSVDTYGKAMVVRFDNDLCVYSHNQLYGKWMIRQAHSYPQTNRQLRFAIHNSRKSALLYSASDIEVIHAEAVANHPFIRNLGPDVMHQTVTTGQVRAQATSDRFRRRGYKGLLLEQAFLAGVGNYLRSEILFVARLHPNLRPMDCSNEQLDRFSAAALAVPRQSYAHNGITANLDLAAQLKAAGEPRRLYRHWVFNRGGHPCRICGSNIIKETTGGRRYYYCPGCQPQS
ncbi:endonuclease VIII [filamentous cyanobacterium CCP5]|nr:endonuclease VIII [filamentous cyanobacterium CCP5]